MSHTEKNELTELEIDTNLQFFYQEHKTHEVELQSKRLELLAFFKKYYKIPDQGNKSEDDMKVIENLALNYTEPRLITLKKQDYMLLILQIQLVKFLNDNLTKQSAYLEMKKKNPEVTDQINNFTPGMDTKIQSMEDN
jgi:hypothetical protein